MLLNIRHLKDVHFVRAKYSDSCPSTFDSVEGWRQQSHLNDDVH